MAHVFNSTGLKPQRPGQPGFLLPEGKYLLEILDFEEKYSSQHDYMVVVQWIVREPKEHDGKTIKYHNVVFKAAGESGAGIAIHFLKTIGEPWQESEQLDIDPARWIKRRVWAVVEVGKYTPQSGKYAGKELQKNVVRDIWPVDGEDGLPSEEQCPF